MNIYRFESYRAFLNENLAASRGLKTELAEFLGCQVSFISQVLSGGKTHFSLEHVKKIGEFLQLCKEEVDYLLLLCMHERAGTEDLRTHFYEKIKQIQISHREINKKIPKRGSVLSDEQKAIYYSHWAYMAVHMLISIPSIATQEKIKNHLKLNNSFVDEILYFLLQSELIEKHGHKFTIGKTRIHLEKKSPFIKSLHQNWRHKAIESLAEEDEINMHYSSVLVLSKKDAMKIKDMILEMIKKKEEILAPSPEEQMMVLNLDYFKM